MFKLILLTTILLTTTSLHYHPPHQQDSLTALQSTYQQLSNNINQLIQNIRSISPTIQQPILLTINQPILSSNGNQLLPTLQISKQTCQQINDDRKKTISTLQQSIKDTKLTAATIPPSDKLDALKDDFNIMEVFMNNLQKVTSQCQQVVVLSQTVWQTNLYAKNWILGSTSFDALVDQYYQRTIQYENVNNCPLSTPFFDSKRCIACPNALPIFNINTKKCAKCQEDTTIDDTSKRCVPINRYTEYTNNLNYALDGAPKLPLPPPDAKPCPSDTPFYNGLQCVNCPIPKYWSVGANTCKQCPQQQKYDINIHECAALTLKMLTLLDDTNWVTNDYNVTRVYAERDKLLKENQTSKDYKVCNLAKPYYDNILCIFCPNEYNVDTKLCSTAPTGYFYDRNVRGYVKKEVNKESNSNAKDYIGERILDTYVPDCEIQKPYFDGIACIKCLPPKNIYNTITKRCGLCEDNTYLDQNTHTCSAKTTIYISKKYDKILPISDEALQNYKKEIQDKIKNNPHAILKDCLPTQYSNYDKCIDCNPQQYFSVITKTCQPVKYINNQKGNQLLQTQNYPYSKYGEELLAIIKEKKFIQCPSDTPYSTGNACVACNQDNPIFNIQTKLCTKCTQPLKYFQEVKQCLEVKYLIDLTAENILEDGTSTIEDTKNKQEQIKKTFVIVQCDTKKPFSNGHECISCDDQSKLYFNLKTLQCQSCLAGTKYSSTTHKCLKVVTISNVDKITEYLQTDDYKLENLKSEIQKAKNEGFVQTCPEDAPFYGSNGKCTNCDVSTYFNLKTKQCQGCPNTFTYIHKTHSCLFKTPITNIQSADNYIQTDDYNLNKVKEEEQKIQQQKKYICPAQSPFSNGKSCRKCREKTPYFNLKLKQCVNCGEGESYVKQLKKCLIIKIVTNTDKADNYIETETVNLKKVKEEADAIPANQRKVCQQQKPFSTGKQCLKCQAQNPYFNLETKKCVKCGEGESYVKQLKKCLIIKIVTNTDKADNYIETETVNLKKVKEEADAIPANQRKVCQQQKPFSTGKQCLKCQAQNPYFNLETKKCVNCGEGESYVKQLKKCLIIKIVTNTDKADNYIETETVNLKKVKEEADAIPANQRKVCQQQKPFSTGKQCLKCQAQNPYFNLETKKCVNCGEGESYVKQLKKCLIIKIVTNTDKADNYIETETVNLKKVKEEADAIPANQRKVCQQQKPFSTGVQCIKCQAQNPYFNLETKKCVKCGEGQTYIKQTRKCTILTVVTNVNFAKGYIETQKVRLSTVTDQANKIPDNLKKICQESAPFSDGTKCIICQNDNHFNLETKKCQQCADGLQYNAKLFQCKPRKPRYPYLNSKWIVNDQNPDKIFKLASDLKQGGAEQCPQATPFYNTKTKLCLSCQTESYYNYDSLDCEKCAPKMYDINVHSCLEQVINKYQTSLSSPKLVYGGYPPKQYQGAYNSNKAKNPDIQDCPAQKPYFDLINCIKCPDRLPYFNMRYNRCQICEQGSNYIEGVKQCKIQGGSSVTSEPNIAKMYANIF